MLGFGFYELSGGADFVPEVRPLETVTIATKSIEPIPFDEPVVTRASVETTTIAPIIDPVVEVALDTTPAVDDVIVETVPLDIREVAGRRVNMRSGPGTNFDVLVTLDRGTATEVVDIDGNGWAQVRVIDTDQIGWMAERLLTDS